MEQTAFYWYMCKFYTARRSRAGRKKEKRKKRRKKGRKEKERGKRVVIISKRRKSTDYYFLMLMKEKEASVASVLFSAFVLIENCAKLGIFLSRTFTGICLLPLSPTIPAKAASFFSLCTTWFWLIFSSPSFLLLSKDSSSCNKMGVDWKGHTTNVGDMSAV